MLQPSKFTSTVGNSREFFRGKQCFNSNHLVKKIAEVIIPSKICVQFTIFSTYFSTKFLFRTRDIICMCQRSVCMCYKKSDLLHIFGSLFTLFLFVCVAVEQALLSRRISSYRRNSMTSHLGNFYFVSFFYHLFICRRQRKTFEVH